MTIEILKPNGELYKTIGGEEAPKTSYNSLFEAICLFDLEMLDNDKLAIVEEYKNGEKLLEEPEHQKEALHNFALDYQRAQTELSTSYEELAFWGGFFSEYGEKLGLSEEFRENGII